MWAFQVCISTGKSLSEDIVAPDDQPVDGLQVHSWTEEFLRAVNALAIVQTDLNFHLIKIFLWRTYRYGPRIFGPDGNRMLVWVLGQLKFWPMLKLGSLTTLESNTFRRD